MLNRRTLLKAGLGAAVPSLPAWAQDGPGFGVPPIPSTGYRRKKLGDIEVIALSDGVSRRPLTEQFVTNAPLAEVRALLAVQGLPTDYIDVPYTPFVLVFGGRKLLFDAGLGEYGGPTAGKLLTHLRAAGLQAGDIDTVVISHFHGDHIHGLRNKAGDLAFPKARVLVPAPEYAFWMDDGKARAATDERSKGLFANARRVFGDMPEAMLQRFEPGAELLPGLRSMPAYGHTPGHTVFEAGRGPHRFHYLADLTNVPALFARQPDWAVGFDMDPAAASRVRREIFARLVSSRAMVGGFHFPFPAFGHIEAAGSGYAFKPQV
ncbi:MAG: MBL fold metallo-hydrolase [Methylibium sp.]|uniref:MBL fold metallo-hydrolase n=1 Tax=Methylibium sp. TaxID=2067992 RepID=UPI0017BE2BF5|nr:MBL fold metallo-hydrolase [Methylibium sp.]MBA3595775.1 MBL fold metallo-hydrolase [Methylibium sp.]